jgi:hypothetical protein
VKGKKSNHEVEEENLHDHDLNLVQDCHELGGVTSAFGRRKSRGLRIINNIV